MIRLEEARRAIDAAMEQATKNGQPSDIAVVDRGGNLVAFARMDNAWIGSIDVAINKAWTACAFDMDTKSLAKIAGPGDQAFGIHVSNGGRVMIFGGGIPLKRGEEIVGAIGVSGGTVDQDVKCADAGVKAFEG